MRTLLAFATLITIASTASAQDPRSPHIHPSPPGYQAAPVYHGQGHHGHIGPHGGPFYRSENPFRLPIGVRPDPIPPLGNNLPYSHRARYNRPSYIAGKIAYHIAPSSQEAMSWHENVHRGSYRNHAGWIESIYIYPKPWEVLTVGPRTTSKQIPLPVPVDNE